MLQVDSIDLLVKLGVSILMPVLVGKGLREAVKPLRETIPRFKAPLYLINNLQVIRFLCVGESCVLVVKQRTSALCAELSWR